MCCAYQCNTTLTPAASILYLVCPDRCAVSRCPTGAGKSAPVISGQSFPSLVLLRIFWACKVTEYHFFFLSNCCSQRFRHCCSRSSWPHSNLSDEKTFNGKSSQNWLNYIFLFLLPLLGCTQPSEYLWSHGGGITHQFRLGFRKLNLDWWREMLQTGMSWCFLDHF